MYLTFCCWLLPLGSLEALQNLGNCFCLNLTVTSGTMRTQWTFTNWMLKQEFQVLVEKDALDCGFNALFKIFVSHILNLPAFFFLQEAETCETVAFNINLLRNRFTCTRTRKTGKMIFWFLHYLDYNYHWAIFSLAVFLICQYIISTVNPILMLDWKCYKPSQPGLLTWRPAEPNIDIRT